MSKEDSVNYVVEMLKHEVVLTSGLVSLILGFILMMIAGGSAFFAPPLLFLMMVALSILFISPSPVFQDGVNRKIKADNLDKSRAFLLDKLTTTRRSDYGRYQTDWRTASVRDRYKEMMGELEALKEIASNNQSAISPRDLENLDEAAVNFLRLAYALQHIQRRVIRDSSSQIDMLDVQISRASGIDKRKLLSIRADLLATQSRRDRIPAKKAAIAAQMESIYQAFSDIHYQVVANPGDTEVVKFLREATSRLQIEEEISMDTDLELSGGTNDAEMRSTLARIAAKARNRAG